MPTETTYLSLLISLPELLLILFVLTVRWFSSGSPVLKPVSPHVSLAPHGMTVAHASLVTECLQHAKRRKQKTLPLCLYKQTLNRKDIFHHRSLSHL